MANKNEKEIIELFESYRQQYLKVLKSDLEQYEDKLESILIKNSFNSHQKMIDVNFDMMERSFERHKIRIVKEEIEIVENLDSSIFDKLAYIFDINTFSIFKEEENYLPPLFINEHMTEPIFNAILYLKKIERLKIDWVNYTRNLKSFKAQLKKRLKLTENFFHLIPVQSEDDILRIFLTRMHQIHLNIESEAIKKIVISLFSDNRERLPKNLEVGINGVLIDAGYYSKHAGVQ